jgi:beta-glucosidase
MYEYCEGLFVGQRWFTKNTDKTYKFPFGFGLSYTTFEISDLEAEYVSAHKVIKATFKVKNTGNVDGDAVPMLFLDLPKSTDTNYPSKLFKGFEKIFIRKGETKDVTITVDEHGLSHYNDQITTGIPFSMDDGTYKVYVGFNAGDLTDANTKTVSVPS